jgi:serine/threonine-protein kinase RsbW
MPVEQASVPATIDGVASAAAAFDAFCGRADVPARVRWRFQVALDEILSNVVRHGYRDRAGTMTLTFAEDERGVSIEIVDSAPAFDPRQAPPPDTTSPLEARRPGGLGVTLTQSLLDELAYERRGEQNHVTLTWRRPPGEE